jgi:hypothetical protein
MLLVRGPRNSLKRPQARRSEWPPQNDYEDDDPRPYFRGGETACVEQQMSLSLVSVRL